MFEMKNKLEELEKNNSPIQVAVVGIGKMGRSLTDRLLKINGMRPSLIVNRHIQKAVDSLLYLGIPEEKIEVVKSVSEFESANKALKFSVTDDFKIATESNSIDAVVEATGNPQYGAEVAYSAIKNKKHIIMLNVECDSVVGPSLYKMAKENDVIYTGATGDEPAVIIELMEFAEGLGFEIVACGKGKNNPKNIHATNESVSDAAKLKNLCEKSLTSFVDTTNTMIELNAVGNATGFIPDVLGCHSIKSDINSICDTFKEMYDNKKLKKTKVLEYVLGIAPGVFVIIKDDTKETKETLKYLGMGNGPYHVLYRPFHLCSLETPISIYNAVIEKKETIAPYCGQICDTVAFAKRDLKKGEFLQGIGSNDTYGNLTTHADATTKNLLPIALITDKTRLKKNIKKDEPITYDMVELDETKIITKLRFLQDKDV